MHSKTTVTSVRHVNDYGSFLLLLDESIEHYEYEKNNLDSMEAFQASNTEVEKGRLLFFHTISLTRILADTLGSLYFVQADQELRMAATMATRSALAKAKPLQIRLREWHMNLPDFLSIEDVKVRKLSSTGYLHLAYYATEITLHRRLVRTLSNFTDPELVNVCRNAAKARLTATISFIRRLRPEHLQSFWYFSSRYSSALVGLFQCLLAATSQSKDEERYYLRKLAEDWWILRVSSKSVEFLEKLLASIETYTNSLESVCQDESRNLGTKRSSMDPRLDSHNKPNFGFLQDDYDPLPDLHFSNARRLSLPFPAVVCELT
ncbi:MAG: hypothetical protein Q9170_002445 [Blastenia crenularia]